MNILRTALASCLFAGTATFAPAGTVDLDSTMSFVVATTAQSSSDLIFGSGSTFNPRLDLSGGASGSLTPAGTSVSDQNSHAVNILGMIDSGPTANGRATINTTHTMFMNISNASSADLDISFTFRFVLDMVVQAQGLPEDFAAGAVDFSYTDSRGGSDSFNQNVTLANQPVSSPTIFQHSFTQTYNLTLAPDDFFDFSAAYATNGNLETFQDQTVVPIPASLPLILAGLGVLGLVRCRRS